MCVEVCCVASAPKVEVEELGDALVRDEGRVSEGGLAEGLQAEHAPLALGDAHQDGGHLWRQRRQGWLVLLVHRRHERVKLAVAPGDAPRELGPQLADDANIVPPRAGIHALRGQDAHVEEGGRRRRRRQRLVRQLNIKPRRRRGNIKPWRRRRERLERSPRDASRRSW